MTTPRNLAVKDLDPQVLTINRARENLAVIESLPVRKSG
jgi:hypothetical protein